MPDLHSALIVAVVALVTIGLRFLPFAVFSEIAERKASAASGTLK